MDDNKMIFKDILETTCSERFDVEKVMSYLEKETDFFQAPASSKFHSNINGGLLLHSLNVYNALTTLCETMKYKNKINYDDSSLAIVALFHDLCKVNFYKLDMRNVKINDVWTKQPYYAINDKLPLGHGEKSVIMLLRLGLNLTDDEIYAIRWHMGAFDLAVKGGDYTYNTAVQKCQLLTLLEAADLIASQLMEDTI